MLPLEAPPTTQPYTLIRRVPFKSVVVMEQRGVLVAIAGRRDGVRVYALEEVKRAIEWRMDVEIRRERDRARREEAKKANAANAEAHKKAMSDKDGKTKLFSSSHGSNDRLARRSSISVASPNTTPRTPVKPVTQRSLPATTTPAGPPPAYSAYSPPALRTREPSAVNLPTTTNRARTTSVNDVLAGTVRRRPASEDTERDAYPEDAKPDWASSDDEAINPVAAPSGSQALDERTSAAASGSPAPLAHATPTPSGARRNSTSNGHRHRPGNLDLSMLRPNTGNVTVSPGGAPPSPTPTLLTLRQALLTSPGAAVPAIRRTLSAAATRDTPEPENDDDEDPDPEPTPSSPTTPTRERISLAEALFESRMPDLPPVGSRQPQEAIMISSVASGDEEPPASPRTSDTHSTFTRRSTGDQSSRRRRRWSVFDGIFPNGAQASSTSIPSVPEANPEVHEALSDSETRRERTLSRSQSTRAGASSTHSGSRVNSSGRPSTADGHTTPSSATLTSPPPPLPALTPSGSRFIPRIITNAFHGRRINDDRPPTPRTADSDSRRNMMNPAAPHHAPAPKLEYVKLPGTKGSVMIKAVETAKKRYFCLSFKKADSLSSSTFVKLPRHSLW